MIPAERTISKNSAVVKHKIHPDQKNMNAYQYVVSKDERAATKALDSNGAQVAGGFRTRVDLAPETSSRDRRLVLVGNLPLRTVVGTALGLWELRGGGSQEAADRRGQRTWLVSP